MRNSESRPDPPGKDGRAGKNDKKHLSEGTRLIELANDQDYWHSPDGTTYVTVAVGDHVEHLGVRSRTFRRWLQKIFYRGTGNACGSHGLQDAIGVLEAVADDGPEHLVFIRCGQRDGKIYIDLCNPSWAAIEVDADGWRIVNNPPVRFRRAKAMLSLPTPERGGQITELRRFVNVAETDWPLVLGWLVAAVYPSGPYPVLCFSAEQGSGKSTTARVLRALVDPNTAPLRCEPREARDLMIAANNGWLVALDNLSHVSTWLSDALCRLSTGGGFSTRTLYENDEETIFDSKRPILLNGIDDVIARGDLLDRAIIVNLPTIREDQRRAEADFWQDFETVKPAIFGALLDALSVAMRNLPTVCLATLPRMADFAKLATAAEVGLGLDSGSFAAAYCGNISDSNSLALDATLIATHLMDLAMRGYWQGTSTELLAQINQNADETVKRERAWPKSARALSGTINRIAPNLRRAGIALEHWREPDQGRRRMLSLARVGNGSSEPSAPSETAAIPDTRRTQADDRRTVNRSDPDESRT